MYMQAPNNKDKNESNANFLAELFYHTWQLISGFIITTSAILATRGRLLVQGILVIESMNRIPKAAACIGVGCPPPTPVPPAAAPATTAAPPATTAVPLASTAVPPATTEDPPPTIIEPPPKTITHTQKKLRSETFSQSGSERGSASRSRMFSQSNSDRSSASGSRMFSRSHSAPDSISYSNLLSRSHSEQNSVSRLVDWIFSRSKTASYPSVSFTSDNHSYSPSHSLLFNAMDGVTQTPITLGLPHIPSLKPLERVIPVDVAVVLTGLGVGSGGISGLLNPSYTNTLANILRIVKACQEEDAPALPFFPPYPQVALDSSELGAAAANGAIISTTGIMAAIFAAFLLTGYFRNQIGSSVPHKWLARIAVALFAYYRPNILELAVSSMGHFAGGSRGLAITAMIVWQAVFFGAGYLVYRKVSQDEVSKLSLSSLYESARDFTSKPIRLLMFADMFEADVLAMLSGLKSNSESHSESCAAIGVSMVVVPLIYVSYLVKFHPYESNIELSLVAISIAFQISLSLLSLVAFYDEHNDTVLDAIGWIQFLVMCHSFIQMIASLVIELRSKCKGLQEKANVGDDLTTSLLPESDGPQQPVFEVVTGLRPDSRSSLSSDDILGIQDGEQPAGQVQATTVVDIDPISDVHEPSFTRQKPGIIPFRLIDDEEDTHDVAIEMSPRPVQREESPQDSDSTELQGLSRSPEHELDDSDFESQLLETKTKLQTSLHDSPFSMYYRSVRKIQAPTVVNNEVPLQFDLL